MQAPNWVVTVRSGYIIWRDKNVVIFYTNELQENQSADVLSDEDDEARKCVRGSVGVLRWTEELFLR